MAMKAQSIALLDEMSRLETNAAKAFSLMTPEDNVLVQQQLIAFATARKNLKWISETDLARVVGMAKARIAAGYLQNQKPNLAIPLFDEAAQELRQAGLILTRDELIQLLRNEKDKDSH